MLVTQITILLERSVDNSFEFRRHVGIQAHGRYRSSVQHGIEDHPGGIPAERECSSSHLVQQHAEREQIRARIEFPAPHLLWRHVGDGAQARFPGW